MREHRALRIAGRPGREHDLGEVVAGQLAFSSGAHCAREVGQALHLVQRQAERLRALERLRRDDGAAGARPLRDLLRELGRVVRLERHEDHAEAQRGEERDDVLGPVHAPDEDAVALLQPAVTQVARDARHDVVQIAVASTRACGIPAGS